MYFLVAYCLRHGLDTICFMIARALENEVLLVHHLLERTNMTKSLVMRKMVLCCYECYQDRISGPQNGNWTQYLPSITLPQKSWVEEFPPFL